MTEFILVVALLFFAGAIAIAVELFRNDIKPKSTTIDAEVRKRIAVSRRCTRGQASGKCDPSSERPASLAQECFAGLLWRNANGCPVARTGPSNQTADAQDQQTSHSSHVIAS